jgi:NadR type nicotinamide-nucleotide adenylyltransferase
MPTRGIVIGKFYPPHRGHKHLIDVASSQVDKLTVIVCEQADQQISGDLRRQWLHRIHPNVDVVVVNDVVPADDSEGWARYTVRSLGWAPDVVFTSEPYGEAYARFLGAKHVLVDLERSTVPVSASAIRADPFGNWQYLEPCVRSRFAARVVVVGAESTGTTTLARGLADHYRTCWVPEFGRKYTEAKVLGGAPWRTEEFVFIAKTQNEWEDAMAEDANRILFCDTDSFATSLWHERYMGWTSGDVDALSAGRLYDLYLLTDVDIPFVQDGLRDGEHIRHWMHQRFVEELVRRGKRYVLVSGDEDSRLAVARSVCDEILTAPRCL